MERFPQLVLTKYGHAAARGDDAGCRRAWRSTFTTSALLGQELRAVGTREIVGQVEDPYAGERAAAASIRHRAERYRCALPEDAAGATSRTHPRWRAVAGAAPRPGRARADRVDARGRLSTLREAGGPE